jgi:hypothetical protein
MNEQEQDAAMRALFAATDTPSEGPAFVAGVIEKVKADRERTRLRVQVMTVTLAAVGGLSAAPYLGQIGQTLASAWAKSVPMLPVMSASTATLAMIAVAAIGAYFVAERA